MFTGNEDHSISLTDAAVLTKAYRLLAGPFSIQGHYFSKTALLGVLNQTNAVGIRIYYGSSALLGPKLVVVGVNADGEDLTSGYVLDHSAQCPPNCSSANLLNSDL